MFKADALNMKGYMAKAYSCLLQQIRELEISSFIFSVSIKYRLSTWSMNKTCERSYESDAYIQ
ncbi:MAG: hypothetical protein KUG78_11250 [Kangiellaceae bacterium]|nr:hypothetical protein [Kangiellaceae bacterium]